MAKILLRIFPQQSHHNASFKISNILKERGHHVVYAATFNMKASVEGNGFDFYEISEENDFIPMPVAYATLKKTPFDFLKVYYGSLKFSKYCRTQIEEKDFFSTLIKDINPDLILVDGVFKFFSFQLMSHQVPYAFIETTVSTKRSINIPPLNSSFVPGNTSLSQWRCHLSWIAYQNYFFTGMKKAFRNYARKINYPDSHIDFDRYFWPGFKLIPEINTSLRQFDYPNDGDPNHVYISPAVLETRKEIACDYKYKEAIKIIEEKNKKIVFCSFGTMAWRYANHEDFLKRLVNVFRTLHDCILIVCIENDNLRRELLMNKPDNIYLFRRVPQLELLAKTDIMINHGGLNSVTECILTGVPMLVCPGERYLDQYGNAGRIKYHKIGLQGSLNDSANDILSKVTLLLNNPIYKTNILNLKNKIQMEDSSAKGIEFLESLIKKP